MGRPRRRAKRPDAECGRAPREEQSADVDDENERITARRKRSKRERDAECVNDGVYGGVQLVDGIESGAVGVTGMGIERGVVVNVRGGVRCVCVGVCVCECLCIGVSVCARV